MGRSNFLAAAFLALNRRALDGAIGAEDAAVTGFRFVQRFALGAFPKEQAGVGGHGLRFLSAAGRAGQGRIKNQCGDAHDLFSLDG